MARELGVEKGLVEWCHCQYEWQPYDVRLFWYDSRYFFDFAEMLFKRRSIALG